MTLLEVGGAWVSCTLLPMPFLGNTFVFGTNTLFNLRKPGAVLELFRLTGVGNVKRLERLALLRSDGSRQV